MKSSNLAWRLDFEPERTPSRAQPALTEDSQVNAQAPARARPRPRFDRRTIEIRDQGLMPFRVR